MRYTVNKAYRDPTAYEAIGNIMREERKKKKIVKVWRAKPSFVEFMREQLAKEDKQKNAP